ncbi:MAG: ATP-binding protein [Candidatus Binatia bacterium]
MTRILPINIDDLLHARGIESSRLEFKGSWNEGPTALQALHTICAFANDLQNLNGGYLIIGVAEQDGVAQLPPAGLDPTLLDDVQRWIRGRCNTLDPIYQPVLSPEVVDGQHILVVWAPGSDIRPHQAPESFERGATRKYYVRLGSETVDAKGDLLTQLLQLTAKVPFDDRRALGVPIEKLRETRVREFLSDIRSGLLEESDARMIYRRMYISSPVNGYEVPRNVGLLFFADDPEEWFRGARIEIVQFAADSSGNVIEERTFRGPLHHQLRDALTYLRNFSTQHLEKLGDRPEVKGWVSYPIPAFEEAIVNAIYHRSYEGEPEPTKIYLYPDRIEIISYPGPVPGIERSHLQIGGRIPPVPARNRRIGEFLKELRLAEGRGTGIPKVYRAMAQNGSPEPSFDFDEARSYFRVTLPAHPEYVAITALRDAAHLRAIGDSAGALERVRQAYKALPSSTTLASALIEELGREGVLEEAEVMYEQFKRSNTSPDARVIAAMSTVLLDAGREKQARTILDQLPELLSRNEAIEAAILERRVGRHDRAHQYFEKAGDAIFADARALHEFAQTKINLSGKLARERRRDPYKRDARMRLLREARAMLERVLQMDAPPTRHAWAWFDLGRVLRWLNVPRTDIQHAFAEACKLLPGESRFQAELKKLSETP